MFLDRSVRGRLIVAFLMMLSVTFGFWGVATFVPTYVGTVAAKAGLSAAYYSAWQGSSAPESRYSGSWGSGSAPIGSAASQPP